MEDKNKIEVITGVFRNPRKIKEVGVVISLKNKKAIVINKKTIWGLLRTNFHRAIDTEVKAQKKQGISLEEFFLEAFKVYKGKRKPMQYFVKGGKCMACATMKHPIIVPEDIYKIFNKALKQKKMKLEDKESIGKKVLILQKTKLMKLGMLIDAGDIITNRAIRIIGFAEVLACCNPLAFAKLNRGIVMGEFEPIKIRILRYESITNIESRVEKAIEAVKPILAKVESKIDATKQKPIAIDDARKILVSFCGMYGIGAKIISAVYNKFKGEKMQTQYMLSMAGSYIVEHHPEIFRKDCLEAKNNLAIISGAVLLADDLKKTVKLCERQIKKEPILQIIMAKVEGKIPISRVRK